MPIAIAPLNISLKIIKIVVNEDVKKHLESLGITINGTLMVIGCSGGNVICRLKEGTLALDRDVSSKIFVKVENN